MGFLAVHCRFIAVTSIHAFQPRHPIRRHHYWQQSVERVGLSPRRRRPRPAAAAAVGLRLFQDDYAYSTVPPRKENKFQVTAPYAPMGDQPQAIQRLVDQVERGDRCSILRGITGTGKTNVMAHTIARLGRPTLVLCHNKTLAAQLTRELRNSLKKNHVQLFVSYYNHYIPESFNEVTSKYTAKKSSVNDELDALRHLATRALVEHSDVVIVASVSCIYGMGMPKAYLDASMYWKVGETSFEDVDEIRQAMRSTAYLASDDSDALAESYEIHNRFQSGGGKDDLERGQYQLSQNTTGATLVLWPPSEPFPMRVDLRLDDDNGLVVSGIAQGTTKGLAATDSMTIFPAKHHLTHSGDQFEEALSRIQSELQGRVQELKAQLKGQEAERLSQRVNQDLQLLRETGTCKGVENYSRHMALRHEGDPPDTLLDFFGYPKGGGQKQDDWLLLIDESHVTLPQLRAMYAGDRSRKKNLVKHGYRLPSALDHRPLREDEFWERVPQCIFVSATPSKRELAEIATIPNNEPVEMIIRPTFVCDPVIEVHPPKNQLDHLLQEIRTRARRNERSLAMALTKRDAEDLASYLIEQGVAANYIHSGLNTHERSNALKALQSGEIDCLVGVNLLREGLDLPQVSLVAVLNADSEGFLRSETALLQIVGRAARNVKGTAILYANRVTRSMQLCIDATDERRKLQLEYNEKHGKEMKSTKGSSMLSIFDLLKDQIEAEKPIDVVSDHVALPGLIINDIAESVPLTGLANREIDTDHIPSKPGVYFWKDQDGNTLYIGKAKRLRSRVKSYLSTNAKHSRRINAMVQKARSVEFILTPSDRDALVLESNLIKAHQPAYNVLMKDDETYPYICATIGDAFPQFSAAPRRQQGEKASRYKYFGPYPHYAEINTVLQRIEETYDLRQKSFQARYGEMQKSDYQVLFQKVLDEVFEPKANGVEMGRTSLHQMRVEYEEASQLFASKYNECRDIVAVGASKDKLTHVVHILQLRQGLIAGQFTYGFQMNHERDGMNDEDLSEAIATVLTQKHYPSGGHSHSGSTQFSFFPQEVLIQFPLSTDSEKKELRDIIKASAKAVDQKDFTKITLRTAAKRGERRDVDQRTIQCAVENADQIAEERSMSAVRGATKTSLDGTATRELAELLQLKEVPKRIECYDISHTQGEETVASRVVFEDGRPVPHLYRRFNVRSVDGVDDYASLEEVLERRFRRVWESNLSAKRNLVDKSDPWAMPDLVVIDGGKGQLSSAVKGMAKASIYPELPAGNALVVGPDEDSIVEEDYDAIPMPLQPPASSAHHDFVPIIALAKKKEEVFAVGKSDPVNKKSDSSALLLLRALRDESHRFALKSHRKRRSSANGLSS